MLLFPGYSSTPTAVPVSGVVGSGAVGSAAVGGQVGCCEPGGGEAGRGTLCPMLPRHPHELLELGLGHGELLLQQPAHYVADARLQP